MSEETTVETPETPEVNEPQISLADFSAALQVIDVCTSRGGFRGEELSTIGQLRDQCVQIVAMCEAEQQTAADK